MYSGCYIHISIVVYKLISFIMLRINTVYYLKGIGCEQPDCPGEINCNGRATCIPAERPYCGPCQPGWAGIACEIPCVNGSQSKTDPRKCECDLCFTGISCDLMCSGKNGTKCINGECDCGFEGWRGERCENVGCPGWNTDCSGHGTCNSATGQCDCNQNWKGIGCEIPDCPGEPDCNGNGKCINSKMPYCSCNQGWMGSACEIECVHGRARRTADGRYVCECEKCYSGISCNLECTGRGNCTNGTCDCGFEGWRGPACEMKGCPGWNIDCSGHGSCIASLEMCFCRPGWGGRGCHIPQCAGGGNCSGHGVCDGENHDPPVCVTCDPGYMGTDCGIPCVNGNVTKTTNGQSCSCDSCFTGRSCDKECDSHGTCTHGQCKCNKGWRGVKCETVGCPGEGTDCSNHGVCLSATQECDCFKGWKGEGCEKPDCPGTPDCENKGDCDGSFEPPICVNCTNGTMGPGCNLPCVHGTEDPPQSSICKCKPCFHGYACDIECSGKGYCNSSKCICNPGRKGELCEVLDCPGEPQCSNHGVCVMQSGSSLPSCLCDQGFDGNDCSKLVCPGTPMCNNRGNCALVYGIPSCQCRNEFQGSSCEKCQPRYTGPNCERCFTNYIGWNDNCGIFCVNGYATGPNADVCTCYNNSANGHWNGTTCEECTKGYAMPDCKVCDGTHVGEHCKIDCVKTNAVYRDSRDDDGARATSEVRPLLDCLSHFDNGAVIAWFGYENENPFNVYIDVGPDNRFTRPYLEIVPGGQLGFVKRSSDTSLSNIIPLPSLDFNQPTKLLPGKHHYVFSLR